MTDESALWHWFLFRSGLPTQRAKALLMDWQERNITLAEALAKLQSTSAGLGLAPAEATGIRDAFSRASSGDLSAPSALTSLDPLYPGGLHALEPRLRPALLFYRGDPALLQRTVVYLPPGRLDESDPERLREAVSLLLGEHVLVGVYQDSEQASLVLEEMVSAEGEALLFARSGLESADLGGLERALVDAGRLLILSPLPPEATYQAGWDSILQQVALSAADRVILTGDVDEAVTRADHLAAGRVLVLGASSAGPPALATLTTSVPADVLDWVLGFLSLVPSDPSERHAPGSGQPGGTSGSRAADDAHALSSDESPPPPSPEAILDTLSKGGSIPEILRRRLLDEH